jgi:transcriptional regulator with XRE-family HTH domain
MEDLARQLFIARAALKLSQRDAAALAKVAFPTLQKLENGGNTKMRTVLQVKEAYLTAGVEFQEGGWVRLNPNHVSKTPTPW